MTRTWTVWRSIIGRSLQDEDKTPKLNWILYMKTKANGWRYVNILWNLECFCLSFSVLASVAPKPHSTLNTLKCATSFKYCYLKLIVTFSQKETFKELSANTVESYWYNKIRRNGTSTVLVLYFEFKHCFPINILLPAAAKTAAVKCVCS